MLQKVRPTISDYNQALYKNMIYDKIAFKTVDEMAAIGNGVFGRISGYKGVIPGALPQPLGFSEA